MTSERDLPEFAVQELRPDPRDPRQHNSTNLFLTINTNCSPKTQDEMDSLLASFRGGIRTLLSHAGMRQCIDFLSTGASYKDVFKISAYFNIERGPNKHRIHSHVLLQIDHGTMIRLNLPAVKRIFRETKHAKLQNVYLCVRVVKGVGDVLNYLTKPSA